MDYCLYINLERRTDRRDHVIQQLDSMGATYERVDAIEHSSGAMGCTMSHIRCLEIAKERRWPHVFICEDDIVFTKPSELKHMILEFMGSGIHWNVLMIGANLVRSTPVLPFCHKVVEAQTTTGYIVNSGYYETLLDNFRTGLQALKTHPPHLCAIDIFWKCLQHELWFIIVPLTVSQLPGYSDIMNKEVDYTRYMLKPIPMDNARSTPKYIL